MTKYKMEKCCVCVFCARATMDWRGAYIAGVCVHKYILNGNYNLKHEWASELGDGWWWRRRRRSAIGDRLVGVVAVTKIDCVRAYAILSAAAVSCWFSPSSDWNKWNYAILFCCCCCYIWLCGALDMPRPPTSCCGRLTKVMCIVYYLYIVSFHTALYCCLLWCIFNTDRQIQVLFSVSSGSCGSSKMSYMMHVCSVVFFCFLHVVGCCVSGLV